eukprot:403341737
MMQSPAPGTYDITSKLDSKRFSVPNLFGSAQRDQMFQQVKEHGRMPGPGEYDVLKKENNAPAFTMRQKTKFHDFINMSSSRNFPGPGQYTPREDITDPGSFVNSKYKNGGTTVFPAISQSGSQTSRFPQINYNNQSPSPLEYNLNTTDLAKDGKYYIAKYRNSRAPKIGSIKFQKDTSLINNTPGPGQYNPFSEFGYNLDSSNRYGLPKNQLKTISY